MMYQEAALHDLEFDSVLDAVSCEPLRLGDLRNFRPIEQSDLKLLEELDGFGHGHVSEMRDVSGLMWDDADMKPELPPAAEQRPIDWLRGGYGALLQGAPFSPLAEPTLMELNSGAESRFSLPPCPEVDEDLLLTSLADDREPQGMLAPQDGRFCVPFTTRLFRPTLAPAASVPLPVPVQTASVSSVSASFVPFTKPEPAFQHAMPPSASTLRALLEHREPTDSDSLSESSVGPREPRGRAWSLDTNASGQSTATSGVFELSRSWTSQASSPDTPVASQRPSTRSRNWSTDSTSSSFLSSGSETPGPTRSPRRRTASTRRPMAFTPTPPHDSFMSRKSTRLGCFWYQRDVKARSNLLPVPKLNDRSYEADYDQPNPKRLMQLGNEIAKMSEVLQAVPQPSSVNDDDDKLNKKREKNKFASRVCRLKKKARYEANKIKLFGLKHELAQLQSVLAEARQLLEGRDGSQMSVVARRLRELARSRVAIMVAGSQTEYVNLVLDLAQRPRTDDQPGAGTSVRDRLLSATAAGSTELRSLALKHALPTYAECFSA